MTGRCAPKRDYQTAGCANTDTIVKADGRPSKDGVVSRRDYLADAAFLVGLEGDDRASWKKRMRSCKLPFGFCSWAESPMCPPNQSGSPTACKMRLCGKPWSTGRGSPRCGNGKSGPRSCWFPGNPGMEPVSSKWTNPCRRSRSGGSERVSSRPSGFPFQRRRPMFLHRLHFNLRSREARRDLADPYQLHSTLCRAFSEREPQVPRG